MCQVYKLISCPFVKLLFNSIKDLPRSDPSHDLIRQVPFLLELNFYSADAALSALQIPEVARLVLFYTNFCKLLRD